MRRSVRSARVALAAAVVLVTAGCGLFGGLLPPTTGLSAVLSSPQEGASDACATIAPHLAYQGSGNEAFTVSFKPVSLRSALLQPQMGELATDDPVPWAWHRQDGPIYIVLAEPPALSRKKVMDLAGHRTCVRFEPGAFGREAIDDARLAALEGQTCCGAAEAVDKEP